MILTRRSALGAAILLACPGRVLAEATIPQRASSRVIVDNDFAGDPDGLVALAHQLLTPKTRTTLITSSALDARMSGGIQGAAAGAALARELMRQGGIAPVRVEAGAESFGDGPAQISQAAPPIRTVGKRPFPDPQPHIFRCEVLTVCYPGSDWWEPTCSLVS